MTAAKFIRLAAFAAVAIVASSATAFAASTAYIKGSANVREGPGTSFDIIANLPNNTKVTVEGCTPTAWCVITKGSLEGFVKKSLLKSSPSGDLPFDISIIIGPDFPIHIDLGDDEEDVPSDDPSVCFYQGEDLTGANFCVEPGDYDDDIPGSFDNNIESILIEGGAVVTVCTGTDMGGTCKLYDETMDSLPSSVRNRITSYEVE
jgi:SH3 domain-containing protein/peptidase inhibitor family I36